VAHFTNNTHSLATEAHFIHAVVSSHESKPLFLLTAKSDTVLLCLPATVNYAYYSYIHKTG